MPSEPLDGRHDPHLAALEVTLGLLEPDCLAEPRTRPTVTDGNLSTGRLWKAPTSA